MYFLHILFIKPFAAFAVLTCLATIFFCWSLKRRYVLHVADRFLIGFIGLLSVFQGLRIVRGVGLLALPANSALEDAIELVVTLLCFVAVLMLRLSSSDRISKVSELRLARAAPPKIPLGRVAMTPEESLHDRAVLDTLAWALPKLSAPAFKVYAYLWLRPTPLLDERIAVDAGDLKRHVGPGADAVEECLKELGRAGACSVHQARGKIEISAQLMRLSTPPWDNTAKSAVSAPKGVG